MTKRGRRKEQDEFERMEQKIRELKSVNRSLLKQLKKLGRGYQKYLVEENEEDRHEAVVKVAKKICYTCTIGEYREIIVHNRRFRKCQHCGKKGRVSIIETPQTKD